MVYASSLKKKKKSEKMKNEDIRKNDVSLIDN